MATTIGNNVLTLLDWAKRLDPDGSVPVIAELLSQTNEILTDMTWIEGNLPTGHRSTIRTGLPDVTWRKFYGGVPKSKSTTAQVDDACGMLEARSEPDADLVALNGNSAAFRMSEAMAFIESMNQNMASTLFYGDTDVNPERFNGLSARYTATTAANIGQNVLTSGGSGSDQASVWLVAWGPNTVTGIYPKGSKAGLLHEDLGIGDAFDGTDRYRAYMERFQWKCGLCVKDWRYAVRIANIEVSDFAALVGSQATAAVTTNLLHMMLRAIHRLPSKTLGKPVFYMNRTLRQGLDRLAMEKQTNVLSVSEGFTSFNTSFLGVPIRTCDALINTENAIS